MADIDAFVDNVYPHLANLGEIPAYDRLLEFVRLQAKSFSLLSGNGPFTEEEIKGAVDRICTRHDTKMGLGALFEDPESYVPWLADKRGEISFLYWNRYKKWLQKKFSGDVVESLDAITDKILDHLENPQKKEGKWERKGLVVGNVQSGKTANYVGVMCKAADAGYKVIVVLGGMLNSLRNQTQKRIDFDFLGYDTKCRKPIGVSQFDDPLNPVLRPFSMTSATQDFKTALANQMQIELEGLKVPVILVLKKNATTLKSLRDWLDTSNNSRLSEYPLLLIDDEADQASINVNKAECDPTRINQEIRELLKMFPRNSYLGYTATPFANIFISPESEHEMTDGEMYRDLFPRDFILSLDPPSNYVGPTTVFGENSEDGIYREIDDNDDLLPLKHDKTFIPGLPESLKKAIRCFMLVKTIRELDGQKQKHHSMMINVSRFTDVQENLKSTVLKHLREWQNEIKSWSGLPENAALRESPFLRELKETWEEEFAGTEGAFAKRRFSWPEVQGQLNASVSTIDVVSINNKSTDRLDYDDYPDGRSIIAVGGLGLSRGLTLEGLSVSYFLRNSVMYDTLLQMGRWFGYREGYGKLCRLFMTKRSYSWYAHIASAVEELRGDFREMERSGRTPMEFGLKVRAHPTALIVTARNKMRDAEQFVRQIALEGRCAETSRLINKDEVLADNRVVLEDAVKFADQNARREKTKLGWLWQNVPLEVIEKVVREFKNAPDCLLTTKDPLLEHLSWLKGDKGISFCDVLLKGDPNGDAEHCAGIGFDPIKRSLEDQNLTGKRLTFIKRHVLSRGDEAAGLSPEEIQAVEQGYDGENVPDAEFRRYKLRHHNRPLLILVFASVYSSVKKVVGDKARRERNDEHKVVPAYCISFPGDSTGKKRPEKMVSYTVNKVWLKDNAEIPEYDDDDIEEDG